MLAVNDRRIAKTRDLESATAKPSNLWRITIRRGGQPFLRAPRMTARAKREGPSLFAAAGLDRDAPRPLADKLRPTKLDEVVGQDQILGPGRHAAPHARHPHARLAGVLGPPGTGKTTVARLLAQATDLHFVQISAIFTGVADLKKAFDEARARRISGRARCSSSMRSIASTARSRTVFCR